MNKFTYFIIALISCFPNFAVNHKNSLPTHLNQDDCSIFIDDLQTILIKEMIRTYYKYKLLGLYEQEDNNPLPQIAEHAKIADDLLLSLQIISTKNLIHLRKYKKLGDNLTQKFFLKIKISKEFDHCNFDGAQFFDCYICGTIKNSSFNRVLMIGTTFDECLIDNVFFNDIEANKDISFYSSTINNTNFSDSSMPNSSFLECSLTEVNFNNVDLENSQFGGSFKNISFNDSKLNSSCFSGNFNNISLATSEIDRLKLSELINSGYLDITCSYLGSNKIFILSADGTEIETDALDVLRSHGANGNPRETANTSVLGKRKNSNNDDHSSPPAKKK